MPAVLQERVNTQQDLPRSPRHSSTTTPTKKLAVLAAANRLRAQQQQQHQQQQQQQQQQQTGPGQNGAAPTRNVSGVLGQAPLVVESQRYEEWMKIATDNKITSTNTWNLALIDYFHDMSLLRNGDDDSINFQKASCTLDGCVKIWTSRVDSVATETGKLLSGLAEDGRNDGLSQDLEEEDNDDDDDEAREKKAKKKTRQAATLADSFNKIKVKTLDLEFTVDPLFAKTSADFDEGGAGGILMNHLGCDGNMKVVFDAGDAKLEASEEDEEDEQDDSDEIGTRVDLDKLRARCFPEGIEAVQGMSLCPSLASFRFSADAHLDLEILNPIDEELPAPRPPTNSLHDDDDLPVFPETNSDDIYTNVDFGGGEEYGEVDFFADDQPAVGGGGPGVGPVEDFDARHAGTANQHDLVMSMDATGEEMFGYFDNALSKNWAGPEHWKMRRVMQKKDDGNATAKQRKEKVVFSLDFDAPPPLPQSELFAPAQPATIRTARKSSLGSTSVLGRRKRSSAKSASREDTFQLPDDFHFNSQMLLRLFLKPRTTLKMRRRGPIDGEPDARYWAQAAPFDENGDTSMGGMDPRDLDFAVDDDYGDGFVIPFDTQILNGDDDDDSPYFNDDEDEPGLDAMGATPDGAAGTDELSDDILKETQGQLKRVRPENINYAKRAKRVDVKKLKDSIWKELEDVTIPVKELPTAPSYQPETQAEAEPLVPVVSGLRKIYPKDKMEEISTSFCFICLLHLANEKGLRIQTPAPVHDDFDDGQDEGLQMRKNVGGLEGLRVFREVAQA